MTSNHQQRFRAPEGQHPYSPYPGGAGGTVGAASERQRERELSDKVLRLVEHAFGRLRVGLKLAAQHAEEEARRQARGEAQRTTVLAGEGKPLSLFETELLACFESYDANEVIDS